MNAADGYAALKEACNRTLTESQREATQRDLKRLDDLQWARDMKKYQEVLAKLPKPQLDLEGSGDA